MKDVDCIGGTGGGRFVSDEGVCRGNNVSVRWSIGSDPRVLRGGNVPSVFNIGHWLRDGWLTFKSSSVQVANSPCDNYMGNYPLQTDNGNYEVIIVGAGYRDVRWPISSRATVRDRRF